LFHVPSLIIGAGVTSIVAIIVFLVLNVASHEDELLIVPTPNQESDLPKITTDTFMKNGSPILGNSNAPVTLIEFGDYQCFYCNKFFHSTEDSIVKNYVDSGKVKIIFKDYTIIGPDSITAANAAHCANDQKSFWKYHDTLYNNWDGENTGWASYEHLLTFAVDTGLNIDEFSNCIITSKYSSIIVNSNQDAKDLGLTGTPAFFIIGPDNKVIKIGGAQPYDVFEGIFNSELKK
jgi:protein-disulfide isomerase